MGRQKRPSAKDARAVPYPEVRDRFLTASQRTSRVAWLVEVGRFVEDRWLAEEAARCPGQPLDEEACWDLWDQCSEKYLRDLRTEARTLLQGELRRRRIAALVANWRGNAQPLKMASAAAAWVFAQWGKAVAGAIGVILFGWLMISLFPSLVYSFRSSVDKLLLPETSRSVERTSIEGPLAP